MESPEEGRKFYCNICNSEHYEEDWQDNSILCLEEWLTIMTQCVKCGKNGCIECLLVCYTCCNYADMNEPIAICNKCCDSSKFKKIDCRYHSWIVCHKHSDEDCGECHANKNYDQKMS